MMIINKKEYKMQVGTHILQNALRGALVSERRRIAGEHIALYAAVEIGLNISGITKVTEVVLQAMGSRMGNVVVNLEQFLHALEMHVPDDMYLIVQDGPKVDASIIHSAIRGGMDVARGYPNGTDG